MESTKILVVEDEGIVALNLQHQLERLGYGVTGIAINGDEALRLASDVMPDLVLMDIRLAGEMDGIETAAQIRQQFAIPVIFLTAYADTGTLDRAKQTQPLGYLVKPFGETELRTTIEIALMRHQLEQQERAYTQRLQEEIKARQQVEVALAHERDQLCYYVAELETRNEEMNAFAHTVAHDLKNPLAVILGLAALASEDHTALPIEDLQTYIGMITRSAQKMTNIIDELLLLARVRHTDVALHPLDMADIVAGAVSRLTATMEDYQAEIVLPSEWPQAMGYAAWVEEVWVNYLSNAIKYGGQPPSVTLGAASQPDGTVRFWVQDNGPGLTPEDQNRLFSPFTQLAPTRAEGHGLGLSIVRRIVDKLGGQAGIESQIGQGSAFFFTLPATDYKA